MTRTEHEDLEGYAMLSVAGLLASGHDLTAQQIATRAFDMAAALQEEKLKRIGEKPGYED